MNRTGWIEISPVTAFSPMWEARLLAQAQDTEGTSDQVHQIVRFFPTPRSVQVATQIMQVAAERDRLELQENDAYANGSLIVPIELGTDTDPDPCQGREPV